MTAVPLSPGTERPWLSVGSPSGTGDGNRDVAVSNNAGGLTRREFFEEVVARLRPMLPEERRGFRHRATPFLLKIDFGNQRVHYEVWCDTERSILGVGLHFEDGPASTAAYLAYFDRLIVEIKHELGTEIELERWTASWGHFYEHRALTPLTDVVAAAIAGRLAVMIGVLQPLVEAAEVGPERSAASGEEQRTGSWRKWRR